MNKKIWIILCLFFIIPVGVNAELTSDLISYYSFDSGSLSDEVGSYDLTNVGAVSVTGKMGDAYNFTASEDDRLYTDSFDEFGSGDHAFNYWFLHDGTSDANIQIMLDYHNTVYSDRLYTGFRTATTIQEWAYDYLGSSTFTKPSANAWHMATIVKNGTSHKFYIDGSQESTDTGSGSLTFNYLTIGSDSHSGSSSYDWNGAIDELAVWGRALSPDDISELYNSGSGHNPLGGSEASPFFITAVNNYNSSAFLIFNATIDEGITYNTTNGTLHTTYLQNETILHNITIEVAGFFSQTYENYNMSSNIESGHVQTQINLAAFEYLSAAELTGTFQNSTGTNLSLPIFYNSGNHTFTFINASFWQKSQEFEVFPLFNGTLNITGVAGSIINITAQNAYSLQNLTEFSGWAYNIDEDYNESFNTSTGYAEVSAINGNYTLFVESPGYAVDDSTNWQNITVSSTLQNASFSLWSNNSIRIRVYDENTQALTIGTNISIVVTGNASENTYYTTDGTYFLEDLQDGNYTLKFSGGNYTTKTYTVTVADQSTQELDAYLSSEYQTVTFTISNYNNGATIESASFTVARLINSTYTVTESKNSDITGRVQVSYLQNVKYRFTVTKEGYQDKVFYLDPVIFSSYTVYLVPIEPTDDAQIFQDVSIVYTPKIYYNDATNNLTFSFSSPDGTFSYYGFNLTYPGNPGSLTYNGTLAIGEQFDLNFNIVDAALLDTINITYWYDTTLSNQKIVRVSHTIVGSGSLNNTWLNLRKDGISGLGDYEKVLIVLLFVIILSGVSYPIAGAKGSILVGCLIWGIGAYLAFTNLWAVLPSILTGIIALIGGRE